jgi:hypothetical protein
MSSFTLMHWQDHFWTALSAASALLVLISSVADRRRHKRTKLDQVGIMPWTGITVFSVLMTVLAAALAIKGL